MSRKRSPSCVFCILYLSHSLWFRSILSALVFFSSKIWEHSTINSYANLNLKVKSGQQVACLLEEGCKENWFVFIWFLLKTKVIGFKLSSCFLFCKFDGPGLQKSAVWNWKSKTRAENTSVILVGIWSVIEKSIYKWLFLMHLYIV